MGEAAWQSRNNRLRRRGFFISLPVAAAPATRERATLTPDPYQLPPTSATQLPTFCCPCPSPPPPPSRPSVSPSRLVFTSLFSAQLPTRMLICVTGCSRLRSVLAGAAPEAAGFLSCRAFLNGDHPLPTCSAVSLTPGHFFIFFFLFFTLQTAVSYYIWMFVSSICFYICVNRGGVKTFTAP